ncbi:MAG: caspase domain-containing protein [Parvibaculaceae bacterium]
MLKKYLMAGTAAGLLALLALSSAAEARTRMLLIGVANYNKESGIPSLLGPRNDVTMMWRLFTKLRGVDPKDVIVLTDGLPQSPDFPVINGDPTIGNIRAALDKLAAESTDKDDVIFYYSGHGTTQPDNDPEAELEPEADGNDQVLLPSDTGPYDPLGRGIKNSLVDDELGAKLTAIRAKGAFVWAIIDSCHSGTVTRGDTVTRSVEPSLLGVPEKAEGEQHSATRGASRKGSLSGKEESDIVGFYAVDAYYEAIERPFEGYDAPMVGEKKKQRMGVFTNALHHALSNGTAQTYADLAREISADLATDRTGGKVPQPVFDGVLDRNIIGGDTKGPRLITATVATDGLEIPRGVLHGFDQGAGIELFTPGKPDEPIGKAVITTAQAASSIASEINWVPGAQKIEQGPVQIKLTDPAITFRFNISPPPEKDLASAGQAGVVAKAIDTAFGKDSGSDQIGIEMGTAGDPDGDVFLRVENGRLWIVRPNQPFNIKAGDFGETPSIAIGDDPAVLSDKLREAVWSIARATKLVRFAAATGKDGEGSNGSGVKIAAEMQRLGDKSADPKTACGKPDKNAKGRPLESFATSAVGNCDVVRFHVTNESDTDTYYIAAFYVDALGGVQTLSNQDKSRGCVRTLYPGENASVNYTIQINTWDRKNNSPAPTGEESTVILAIPQDASKIAPSMCSLIQPTLADMQQTRGVEEKSATRGTGNKLKTLLGGITGSATRGVSIPEDEEGAPQVVGNLFTFDVKP